MPRYRIRAVDRSGKRIVSTIHAIDETTASQSLCERGWTVLAIKPTRTNRRQQRLLQKASNASGGILFRQLGYLLAAGVPINTAVEEIHQLAPKGVLANSWARLSETMNEGAPLIHAMENSSGLLAHRHIAMLKAGQSQNDLAQALTDVGDELAWRAEFLQRWRQVCTYPLFAIALLVVVCVFLITQVVPSLQPLLQPMADELPWMTQKILLIADKNAKQSYLNSSFLGMVGIVCLGVSWFLYKLTKQELFIELWLKSRFAQRWVWPFSVAAHAQTVHVLLKQNIPLPTAVSLAAPAAAWFGTACTWEKVAFRMKYDGLFAEAIQSTSEVPRLYSALIRVGEQHGTLDKSTAMASEVFYYRFKQRLQRVDVLVGPVLLMLAGGLIGMVFLWIILPVYDLISLQGSMV